MSNIQSFIEKLLIANGVTITPEKTVLIESFSSDEEIIKKFNIIQQNQTEMARDLTLRLKIADIVQNHMQIPNGTVGKLYECSVDYTQPGWNEIIFSEFIGLEECGLSFDSKTEKITGTPHTSGEYKIKFMFRVDGEEESTPLNEKTINLIINADPKSLWKDQKSDTTDPLWKEDNASDFETLGDKHIVVSSKRGRSHANAGSFRDDDYAFKHLENSGWNIVAVADGAGSAKASRKGSQLACQEVVNYFERNLNNTLSSELDQLIAEYRSENSGETAKSKISHFIYNHLGGCAKSAHNVIEKFALDNGIHFKEFHTTLIFALFKKYDFGYIVMTFGVGDCPIAIINKDQTDFKLMNWLDVGEFGGGTRFITMPEIFTSDKFSTRFGFTEFEDFSYLMLMTDGIYDAKFVVESNLEKLEKWNEFVADLKGNNDDKCAVAFEPNNSEIAGQLSQWMDFWSPGNHDDRTLAIIF